MKTIILTSLASLVFTGLVLAQNSDTAQLNEKDMKKNEIGVLTTLWGKNEHGNTHINLEYKRYLKNNKALRVSFLHRGESYEECYSIKNDSNVFYGDNMLMVYTDSTMHMYGRSVTKQYGVFKIGLERQKQFKRIDGTIFYGADAAFGYGHSSLEETASRYKLVSDTFVIVRSNANMCPYDFTITQRSTFYRFGITPFVGAKYHFTKWLSISVQFDLDLFFEMEDYEDPAIAYNTNYITLLQNVNLGASFHF